MSAADVARAAGAELDPAVPLTLLTGFLGAGKTTLVNRLLAGEAGVPVAVLVNDFGDVNIDRALIRGRTESMLSLENGCICCSLRDDLVQSVGRLLEAPDTPRRVVLEASGIADPAPVVGTFLAPAFRRRLRLDGVVCVVDAEQAFSDPDTESLQLRQVGFSDLVVLNKVDVASPKQTRHARERILAEFAGARIIETTYCEVPPEILFAIDATGRAKLTGAGGAPAHGAKFKAWQFETAASFDADALHDLGRNLPSWIYRAKGIVRLAGRGGEADRQGVLQVVGRRTDVLAGAVWQDPAGPSTLVFIGRSDAMDPGLLEALARDCLAGA